MDELQQFGHLPVWAAALWVAWKITAKLVVAWKEVSKERMSHEQAERQGHREERREMTAGFGALSKSLDQNTAVCEKQSDILQSLLDVSRVQSGIVAHQRRQG